MHAGKKVIALRKVFWLVFVLIGVLSLVGCDFIKTKQKPTANLARINETYLSKSEVSAIMPKNLSPDDSVIFIRNYIDRWATKQLLLESAKKNLPKEKQQEFNMMVNEYRQELYTEAYKDLLIEDQMDTVITEEQLNRYFHQNEKNYKLKRDIVQLRYIKISKNHEDIEAIKTLLKRFNREDQETLGDRLGEMEFQFLNDSVWFEASNLSSVFDDSKLSLDGKNYLKKDNFIELNDSISLYLIFIKDVRLREEAAPESFLKPRIKRILLNKRKIEFEKQLEKRILDDALERNRFETYN